MDVNRLHEILVETTCQFRKGDEVTERNVGARRVVDIYDMPHESDARDGIVKIDCHFVVVGVNAEAAALVKDELIRLLKQWPDEGRIVAGPSYIEVGGVVGDQGAALRLFALGEALGLWSVITPEKLGFAGSEAAELAGRGFVMITGLKEAA